MRCLLSLHQFFRAAFLALTPHPPQSVPLLYQCASIVYHPQLVAVYHQHGVLYIITALPCISSMQALYFIRASHGIYSFRCKALLCFALRALLGFSERTEEQSALAPLCKHRLASLDYTPFGAKRRFRFLDTSSYEIFP